MEFKDYYKILGVAEAASADDIKKAYRKLARKYHPDVSKEKDAEVKFKEVGEAYEVLKDPEKRAEYDQLKRMGAYGEDGRFRPPPDWESASHFNGGGFTEADARHFSDFFESIFGRGGSAHRTYKQGHQQSFRMRGEDVHAKIALFLEEAFHGCEKQVQVQVPEIDEYGLVGHRSKSLNVKIPAGMGPGQHVRLRGQGAAGFGGAENGDLFLEVELAPHPVYSVDGKDIYLTLPISPWEAALGATVTAPTLNGKVNVKVPKGASSGQKLRLKGRGLPGNPAGDQIIVLQVTLPKSHSVDAEALYKELAEKEKSYNPRSKLGV
ncbi:DnaJ C-terminal domain-containing protein [Hahella aquimaris]|uniref:DnaJ C-terminal domain-containing protein n=1 Tax=Hahella sp. HNIBRBA332 TaxID=3015983 RepID=UPI00273CA085|nr:DnaJ C-terminal domain-containing protein [Hahella sp. HNIBRBA332]WLQ12637.1 DnaJ C-terminal domain-containing protein [Hahella sp. HNIBRBA332]